MALVGYKPITLLKVICAKLRDELNSIDPNRRFTVRSVDTNWEEFVESAGWSKNRGGICWVRGREGGEKFTDGPTHGVDVSTTYLVRTAVPVIDQRNRGGLDGDEQFLDKFMEDVYTKVVEVGIVNATWQDEHGEQLTWDCTVQHGGMFTYKKQPNPLFIFDTYFVTQNTIKYDPASVAE
jgi:hypothetical protein